MLEKRGDIAMARTPVLLLKTKSTPHDGYEELFSNGDRFDPVFVPVLQHHFNEGALAQIEGLITNGAFTPKGPEPSTAPSYGGLIFTSQRAVEAFSTIIERIKAKGNRRGNLDILLPADIPWYVVGPATAKGLRSIALKCEITGEETGNGEALAAFILDHYNKTCPQIGAPKRPLLFLVGEQRRDIIPKTLQSAALESNKRIQVDETTVYETGVMNSFPEQFQKAIQPALSSNSVQWIVVFSPTGCKAMLEGLGLIDEETGKAISKVSGRKTYIATIGPTTRDFLRREFSFEPDVCSAKPSPEGVAAGIAEFENSMFP